MERYWSLRWIMQESVGQIEAIVVKGDLVRIDGLPFMQRVPGLPEDLPRGRKVLLQIMGATSWTSSWIPGFCVFLTKPPTPRTRMRTRRRLLKSRPQSKGERKLRAGTPCPSHPLPESRTQVTGR